MQLYIYDFMQFRLGVYLHLRRICDQKFELRDCIFSGVIFDNFKKTSPVFQRSLNFKKACRKTQVYYANIEGSV